MARTGLRVCCCATLALAILSAGALSAPGDDLDTRTKNQLAVQAALQEGLDYLQRGHFDKAVQALEKRIALIDGNPRYLTALRDAYRGHVAQLHKAGRVADARRYQQFLDILDPKTTRAQSTPPVKASVLAQKDLPAAAPPGSPVPAPVKTPGIVGRGKIEYDDPFDSANKASDPGAKDLLARAENEFDARHYDSAGKLYALANRAEPVVEPAHLEHWGYCRLYRVAQTLSATKSELPQTEELQREVEKVRRLAPHKLDGWAAKLVVQIKEAGAPAVEVKHTPRQGNGWAKAETENFLVYHALPEAEAEKAVRLAEATRSAMTRKWFGEAPATWNPRCIVYLHPTVKGYTRATPAPAASPGHSTISLEAGRVVSRRIDLRCDDPNMMTAVLPHETTHVVLAGRFGNHHVPRWADEGIAVQSEPRERVELHLRNLPMHRREGTLFGVGELVRMAEYPEASRVGPFYAQGVSLVEFLCKKKDAVTFTRFLREGLDSKLEVSLERWYGYHDFAELDRDWQRYAFGEGAVATTSEKRR